MHQAKPLLALFDTRILAFSLHAHSFLSPNGSQSHGSSATKKSFQSIASLHDLESYLSLDHAFGLNLSIFLSHWGHLAMIFLWVSRNLFHLAWNGNYELWIMNPIAFLSSLRSALPSAS